METWRKICHQSLLYFYSVCRHAGIFSLAWSYSLSKSWKSACCLHGGRVDAHILSCRCICLLSTSYVIGEEERERQSCLGGQLWEDKMTNWEICFAILNFQCAVLKFSVVSLGMLLKQLETLPRNLWMLDLPAFYSKLMDCSSGSDSHCRHVEQWVLAIHIFCYRLLTVSNYLTYNFWPAMLNSASLAKIFLRVFLKILLCLCSFTT